MATVEALAPEEIVVSEGWGTALRRFVQEKPLGTVGAVLMIVTILVAIFAPLLSPLATASELGGRRTIACAVA